jgi:hypothetical protein
MMQPREVLKQMVSFNKAAFENSFNTMIMFQGQIERMSQVYMDQAAGISAETKNAMNEWTQLYKKGLTDFKAMIDENFKQVEAFSQVSG